jgi:hypothetical protein
LSALLASSTSATNAAGPGRALLAGIDLALRSTVVTEPVSVRHLLKVNAICMPKLLATITIHEHIFVVIFTTSLACLILVLLVEDLEDNGRV